MTAEKQWLTPRDAAKLSGRGIKSIRLRLQPGHPDHIPNYAHPSDDERRTIRLIDRSAFETWMEAHKS